MYECCRYDNSGSKILGYEKRPLRYTDASMPVGIDREYRAFGRQSVAVTLLCPYGSYDHTYQKESRLI